MKKRILSLILGTVLLLGTIGLFAGCTASCEREFKSCNSDLAGGLERIVIVYDMSGNEMARYEGKIDLATEDGCIQFEYNGKRIVWYNAIVSIIEK